jgi:hypothetical protein
MPSGNGPGGPPPGPGERKSAPEGPQRISSFSGRGLPENLPRALQGKRSPFSVHLVAAGGSPAWEKPFVSDRAISQLDIETPRGATRQQPDHTRRKSAGHLLRYR